MDLAAGYKMTEVGIIPEDWEVCELRDLIHVLTDFTANGSFASLAENVPYFSTPQYARLVRLTDIRVNFKNGDAVYVTEASYKFLAKSKLFGGELLLANVGAYAGYSFIFNNPENFTATLGPNMFLIKMDESKVLNNYVYLASSFGNLKKQLISKAASSAQPKLNKEDVRSCLIAYPTNIEEQRKIVASISSINNFIEEIESKISKKKQIKEGTMQQLLTGKKRLPGFDGEWTAKALWELTAWDKFFTEVDRGKQQKVIKYPYLLAADMEAMEQANGSVYLLATGNYEGWTTEEIAGDYLCEGEIVSIPWGGYANIKYTKGKFVTADNRIATSLDTSVLSNKYLYYYMLQNKKIINSFYRGAGIQHPSMSDVLDFTIHFPSIEEQNSICEILTLMDEEIKALEVERDKYLLIKQGMMQDLLTGKTRLV